MGTASGTDRPSSTATTTPAPQSQRVAIVTGASRGLGLALVERLLRDGYLVIAACRRPTTVARFGELAAAHDGVTGGLVPVEFDITTDSDLDDFVVGVRAVLVDRGLAAVDLLINNAGTGTAPGRDPSQTEGPAEALSLTAVNYVLNLNLTVPVVLAGRMLPELAASGRGTIVNISSDLGSFGLAGEGKRGGAAYSISKTALNRASDWLASQPETLLSGTIVVAVHPGSVITDLGGPDAEITPDVAAANIISSITALTASPSGLLDAATGKLLPW